MRGKAESPPRHAPLPLALGAKRKRRNAWQNSYRFWDRRTGLLFRWVRYVCACACACVAAAVLWLCVTNQARKSPCENRSKRQWPAEQLLELPTNRVQPQKVLVRDGRVNGLQKCTTSSILEFIYVRYETIDKISAVYAISSTLKEIIKKNAHISCILCAELCKEPS